MTGFKQTEIGMLPMDWAIKRVEEVYDFKSKPRNINLEKVKQVPFIPMDLIPDDRLYVRDFELRDVDDLSSGTYIENGDLLIAKITPSFENGKQAIVDFEHKFGFATTEVIPIKEQEKISSKQYLYYYLLKRDIRSFLACKMEGSTGRQRLSKTILGETLIPFPPISEQNTIVHILSKIQSAIETQEKIIQTATELKKALMQKLFTEGLHGEPQKETEIGRVPKSWEVVNVGDVSLNAQYGLSLRGNSKGRYPILRMANQENGRITTDNLQFVDIDNNLFSKFKLKQGDIIFNRTNSIDLVGKTSIFDIEGDYIFASYLIRLQLNNNKIIPYFFNYYFNMPSVQNRLKTIATRGVSQSNISATRLKTFIMPLPPLIEQQEVVKMLKSFDEKLKFAKQKHGLYQALFHSMLNHLMTGQIRMMDSRLF